MPMQTAAWYPWKNWVRSLNKLVITRLHEKLATVLMDDKRVVQIVFAETEDSVLNNIYIGKVKNVVKNLGAAFIEYADGRIGYFGIEENPDIIYTSPHPGSKLREGDELLVQVSRDSVKTKAPVLCSNLNFSGDYLVLTTGKQQIGFSGKLKDSEWKAKMKETLMAAKADGYGIIVRTNAGEAREEDILSELHRLEKTMSQVVDNGQHRTCFSLLYEAPKPYLAEVRDTYTKNLERIITDLPECHEELKDFLGMHQPDLLNKLVYYEDEILPLVKLYSLETALQQALSKKVWLKSGGYLIIEPTEALTVIDVNSGKYAGRKTVRETILKINLEAADEIARQIRLRNLSGIIIVDFIDLDQEQDKKLLMERLAARIEQDPVKTALVDMTKLNLVELTRKKVKRPLHEQIRGME